MPTKAEVEADLGDVLGVMEEAAAMNAQPGHHRIVTYLEERRARSSAPTPTPAPAPAGGAADGEAPSP